MPKTDAKVDGGPAAASTPMGATGAALPKQKPRSLLGISSMQPAESALKVDSTGGVA